VEALNQALRGLPEDRVRYHICWGSWHGPHTHDLPLEHLVDLMLKITAGAYSLEAANSRHEHEWKIWRDVKLPEGKILIPGVVTHHTNVVEHPELVADRIIRYAELVGRENVIAGTDCGMGYRVHPQIAWAKLKCWPRALAWPASSSRSSRSRNVFRATIAIAKGPPSLAFGQMRIHPQKWPMRPLKRRRERVS
jgi:5-methyltetrahydropteroyltriglutamate--homocysteine methyltransferase